jgi:hypothetical protein
MERLLPEESLLDRLAERFLAQLQARCIGCFRIRTGDQASITSTAERSLLIESKLVIGRARVSTSGASYRSSIRYQPSENRS